MRPSRRPFTCVRCLFSPGPFLGAPRRQFHASRLRSSSSPPPPPDYSRPAPRPTTAPRPVIDIKHIRLNPALYEQNCLDRNYPAQAAYPSRIVRLFEQWQECQRRGRTLRERANLLRRQLANPATTARDGDGDGGASDLRARPRADVLAEARDLKERLATIEADEDALAAEMHDLAAAIPNLTSDRTPRGSEPRVLSYINGDKEDVGEGGEQARQEGSEGKGERKEGDSGERDAAAPSDRVWRSHAHIGAELGLLDFAGAAASSGWGWYYLLDEAAQLEQALVSYALAAAARAGWTRVAPPSMVYGHIADACGFRPRDANGEQQIYGIARPSDAGRPELVLAGTAEIPLAGMKADSTLEASELPARRVAASRCYRAEAGARGVDSKGLFRVHEFTKVELFAWTAPDEAAALAVFDEVLALQAELLGALGLRCRVLEMPSRDLGASAARKGDVEAFFPSRRDRNGGWGEVTSASLCTDYQTRRLATRTRVAAGNGAGRLSFPWTVNGTAMAVPRVLAALLENGWDEADMSVAIPAVLRPWMDGKTKITRRKER